MFFPEFSIDAIFTLESKQKTKMGDQRLSMHGFDLDIKPFGEVSKQGDGQFSDLNKSAPRDGRHANNGGMKSTEERNEGRQAIVSF